MNTKKTKKPMSTKKSRTATIIHHKLGYSSYRLPLRHTVECLDCDWKQEGSQALPAARRHCVEHGHVLAATNSHHEMIAPRGLDLEDYLSSLKGDRT